MKQKEIVDAESARDAAEQGHQAAIVTQEKEEARYQAVSLGMAADDEGNTKTYAEQLKEVRTSLTALGTEKEQAKMRIDHLKPLLKVGGLDADRLVTRAKVLCSAGEKSRRKRGHVRTRQNVEDARVYRH